MKKYLIIIILISNFNLFSQNSNNKELEKIEEEITKLKEKIDKGLSDSQRAALLTSILGLEQQKSNIIISLKSEKDRVQQQKEDYNDLQKNSQNQIKQNQQNLNYQEKQNDIQKLKQQQIDLSQRFSNELNNISNSLRNIMMADVRKNLMDRQDLISGFYSKNQTKINKIFSIYNQIQNESFNKRLDGLFKCYFVTQKKYIYDNNNEIINVEDCIINVENNIVKKMYLYGNKEMELNLPEKNLNESKINKGVVTYFDLENLETYRLIILEPYLSKTKNEINLKEEQVGYITLWSDNKKEDGKTVYVQELSADKKQFLREISVKINYAKNEKELKANIDNYPKIAINIGNVINYLGEATSTPFGNIPLHTKTNNAVLKPLISDESRLVEIKKYRE